MELELLDADASHDLERAEKSIRYILESNELCSLATVTPQEDNASQAHIATAFYVFDEDFQIYVFTPPETDHGKNLEENNSIALAIYDSNQEWTDKKQGLQIFGTAAQIQRDNVERVFDLYKSRYPGVKQFAESSEEVYDLDSRFFEISPHRIKIFDEPTFGTEVWVNVAVKYP